MLIRKLYIRTYNFAINTIRNQLRRRYTNLNLLVYACLFDAAIDLSSSNISITSRLVRIQQLLYFRDLTYVRAINSPNIDVNCKLSVYLYLVCLFEK